jgi:hypothetical protein
MDEALVTVASCEIAPDAHVLRGRLEAEGFRAIVADENLADWHRLYSRAAGGVSIQVEERAARRARRILASPPESDPGEDSTLPRCPACGSRHLERDFPYRRVAWILFGAG